MWQNGTQNEKVSTFWHSCECSESRLEYRCRLTGNYEQYGEIKATYEFVLSTNIKAGFAIAGVFC